MKLKYAESGARVSVHPVAAATRSGSLNALLIVCVCVCARDACAYRPDYEVTRLPSLPSAPPPPGPETRDERDMMIEQDYLLVLK